MDSAINNTIDLCIHVAFAPFHQRWLVLQLHSTIREKNIDTSIDDDTLDGWNPPKWYSPLYSGIFMYLVLPSRMSRRINNYIQTQRGAEETIERAIRSEISTQTFYRKNLEDACVVQSVVMLVKYPFDAMYIRSILEIRQRRQRSLRSYIRSLYDGFGLCWTNMIFWMTFKAAYNYTKFMYEPLGDYHEWKPVVWIIPRILDLITYPLATISRRQVLTQESAIEAASNLIANHGWMSLWSGALYRSVYSLSLDVLKFGVHALIEYAS